MKQLNLFDVPEVRSARSAQFQVKSKPDLAPLRSVLLSWAEAHGYPEVNFSLGDLGFGKDIMTYIGRGKENWLKMINREPGPSPHDAVVLYMQKLREHFEHASQPQTTNPNPCIALYDFGPDGVTCKVAATGEDSLRRNG